MNKEAVAKARGRAEHLLELHLGLRNRWAMLSPLLPTHPVAVGHRTGPAVHGLHVVRTSLFLACVQDLAKATLDPSRHAPSVAKIMPVLENQGTLALIAETFDPGPSGPSLDV